ncbi:MAG TPA: esterase-like activity of phytase family protein [Streptomyces sp.]|nr:esterase-like activity of phytase family protein [Streptomyces sp.]
MTPEHGAGPAHPGNRETRRTGTAALPGQTRHSEGEGQGQGEGQSEDDRPDRRDSPARMDPEQSACVLVGVSKYAHLPDLRSVSGSLAALQRLLADDSVWGLPKDRIWAVPDPQTAGDLTEPVYEAAEKATDTLIIYYAGHGLRSIEDDQLYLTVATSRANRSETTVPYRRLKQILESCRDRVKRRVVVLDCCHSGQALDGMAVSDAALQNAELQTKGSYVLTSTAKDEKAHADSAKQYTAFSGELIKILETGDTQRPRQRLLSLDDIHELLVEALELRSLPHPRNQDQDGVGTLPFVWNRASGQHRPRLVTPYWNPRRRVTAGLILAATLAAGAAGGYWAPGLRDQPEQPSAAIPGACGKGSRATLLDVSDRLDLSPHNEFQGNEVAGLSALSFADGSRQRAYAVRDNLPPHIFSLSLGSQNELPRKLKPDVLEVQGIYKADGSRFKEFDGEGLVVEKGGKTALVSSEKTPAIRRVRLGDGRQIGKELPLPDSFQPSPRGVAQGTRNLESLAATPDGKHLYTGMEGPLLGDEDVHGRHQVRIQRYEGSPGDDYELDQQFAYQTEDGLYLSELVAVDKDHLLALERGYISGLGNGIRIYEVDIGSAENVMDTERLVKEDSDLLARKKLLVDLAHCPPGDVTTRDTQSNPLLDNVEGMALDPGKQGDDPAQGQGVVGRRTLYLISDNNARYRQTTRLYSLAVSLRWS